jgi:hypothetical protein
VDPGRKLSAQRLSPRSNNSKGISTSSSKATASSPPKQNRSTSKGEPAPGPPASAQVNHRQGQRRCDRTASLSIPARSRSAKLTHPFAVPVQARAPRGARKTQRRIFLRPLAEAAEEPRASERPYSSRGLPLEVRSILLFVRDFAFRLPVVAVLAVGTTFTFANLRCPSPFAVPVAKPHL